MTEKRIRILLTDDHKSFAEGLRYIIEKQIVNAEVSTASSGEETLKILQQDAEFDLLMTDISMPGISGIMLTQQVKKLYPKIKVLVLSMHNEMEIVQAIMEAEAEGYVLKNSAASEIITAIRDILNDSSHYGREVLNVLVKKLNNEKKKQDVINQLTARENEILQLILSEYSSDEIADKLFISKRTVDAHRANILEKTGCPNIVSLIKFAIRNNLYPLN
jgi:DNA-binding NarL/FixJ family response regulator